MDRLSRPAHSRRAGVYRWWITQRGQERLVWAKSKGLVSGILVRFLFMRSRGKPVKATED